MTGYNMIGQNMIGLDYQSTWDSDSFGVCGRTLDRDHKRGITQG